MIVNRVFDAAIMDVIPVKGLLKRRARGGALELGGQISWLALAPTAWAP